MNIRAYFQMTFTGAAGIIVFTFAYPFLTDMSEPASRELHKLILSVTNILKYLHLAIFSIGVIGLCYSYLRDDSLKSEWDSKKRRTLYNAGADESEDILTEITDPDDKLATINSQAARIKELLERVKDTDKRIILEDSLKFLETQKQTVKARVLIAKYLHWEETAFNKYSELSALELNGADVLSSVRRTIRKYTLIGDKLRSDIEALGESFSETTAEVLPRLAQILSAYEALSVEIESREVMNAIKNIQQLETLDRKLLPSSSVSQSIKILQEIREQPINRQLMYQHLRIKSLDELTNNS